MMAVTVAAIVLQRNLFSVVVLAGIYSFLMATVLVALDAVDVAMTEASVGAGISTVLLLGALYLCGGEEAKPLARPWLPLAVTLVIVGALVYGTLGLPAFSDPQAPILARADYAVIGDVREVVPALSAEIKNARG